jgi:S-adenosylhomocysteine hydrolase
VLLLGLGPVGRAAARRLVSRGAAVEVVEPDETRLRAALEVGLKVQPVDLAEGLERCDLIFDATPEGGFIDVSGVTPITIAAVPGLPSAFTAEAQAALGSRHIHEPLAIGVAVMAARALV